MSDRIVFWYGCNVVRHVEIIRCALAILERLGIDARAAGGPDYCCGTGKDANQTAADGMARRTVTKFNAMQRDRVVAWCPSCHVHMADFMGKAYAPDFSLTYLVDLLHERRDDLARLMKHEVPMRVLMHRHLGFNEKSAVNEKVPSLLRLIPGVEVIEDDYCAPGYMCSLIAAVPAALQDIMRTTRDRALQHQADAIVTLFHQCYREFCGLEAHAGIKAYNYIHLLAQSIGLAYEDEYKAWKKAGADAAALIGDARIAKIGMPFFQRAILPELEKAPPGITPRKTGN